MTGFFVFIGFLLIVGIITIYGWVLHGRERLATKTKHHKPGITPGRFELLLNALTAEGFFEHTPGQLERRVVKNDYLSRVISELAVQEDFFACTVKHGLFIENNPDKGAYAYRYRLCSDYSCIGFDDGVRSHPRD